MRALTTSRIEVLVATLLIVAALPLAGTWLRSCNDDGGYGARCYAAETEAAYRLEDGKALPDADVTPGAVDPHAVADLTGKKHIAGGIERNLCAADFRTGPIRKTIRNFAGLKKRACAEYGLAHCDGTVEGDHLISIEIGGCPDCLANVWPQPMDEARIKDHQVEDQLPKLVCAGKITLAAAQQCMAHDWVACAARVRKIEGKP